MVSQTIHGPNRFQGNFKVDIFLFITHNNIGTITANDDRNDVKLQSPGSLLTFIIEFNLLKIAGIFIDWFR